MKIETTHWGKSQNISQTKFKNYGELLEEAWSKLTRKPSYMAPPIILHENARVKTLYDSSEGSYHITSGTLQKLDTVDILTLFLIDSCFKELEFDRTRLELVVNNVTKKLPSLADFFPSGPYKKM